jgi:hypothetical protein
MQLIGTTLPKQINNGLVLQLRMKKGCNRFKEGRGGWTGHRLAYYEEQCK